MTELNPQQQPGTPAMNWTEKIINIFFEPGKVFSAIRDHMSADWLIPLALILALNTAVVYFTYPMQLDFQENMISDSERIPEEMKEDMMQQGRDRSPVGIIGIGLASTLFLIIIIPVLFGATVMLIFGNFIFGGELPFKQLVAAYSWASMISLLGYIIKGVLIYFSGSMEVYTGLAILFDQMDKGSFVFQFFNIFDIFFVWELIVVAIGFAVLYRLEIWKGILTSIVLYGIVGLIKIGQSMLAYAFL